MVQSGTHYELAFESFLQNRRLEYVTVDQARKAYIAGESLKSFDFIVYPTDGRKLLIDVKGRKLSWSAWQKGRFGDSWTTAQDVESMGEWEDVFGFEYQSAFLFAYWLWDMPKRFEFANIDNDDIYYFQQRNYIFVVTDLNEYRLRMKRRSPKWDTVYVPASGFNLVSRSFDSYVQGD